MQIQLIPDGKACHLWLSGELTLVDIEQLKAELITALEKAPRVIVETQGLSHIDVACLQLLHSAHESAQSRRRELVLNSRQSEEFKRQIVRCGLISGDHCRNSGKKDYFWNGSDQ